MFRAGLSERQSVRGLATWHLPSAEVASGLLHLLFDLENGIDRHEQHQEEAQHLDRDVLGQVRALEHRERVD